MWLDYSFEKVFGITDVLTPATSDLYYNQIEEKLSQPEYFPRALFDKFGMEVEFVWQTSDTISNR